ncbi:MAG: murein hydrolase activator EnvC family protein [Chitinophagales bacterium]
MRIALLFLCLFLTVAAIAQKNVQYTMTKEQLEAKKKEIQESIKETEAQLETIKNKKGATLAELQVLQNKLAERQSLINNINDQLDNVESTIKSSSKEILTLKQKLDQLKIRYAQSIRYAYTTRSSYDMMAFLFSSRDFNDAMRRMKYLKKFRDFRKDQVEQIYMTQTQLQHKIGALNVTKEELVNKQKEKVEQTQKLKEDADKQNQVLQELKGRESELLKSIEKNRKIANNVNKAIQHYIEMEMEKARKAAEEEEKRRLAEAKREANAVKPTAPGKEENNPPPATGPSRVKAQPAAAPELMLTPTDMALASNFEGNKGKLYWPVERGYISDHFGTHPHPVEQKVMIENSGIDIQTDQNATVRAVYDGTVTNIFSPTGGSSESVMIKHGNYFTVYNGLSNVSVTKDQHVTAKQIIGKVGNGDDNIPTINFQIWKAGSKGKSQKLNPELWIGKAH